uniref:Uncharacterized protein n=1 Tax=Panagrolaimus sp. PS1159 TaxID=55785 RepID=A0AC35F042_9BILA
YQTLAGLNIDELFAKDDKKPADPPKDKRILKLQKKWVKLMEKILK